MYHIFLILIAPPTDLGQWGEKKLVRRV